MFGCGLGEGIQSALQGMIVYLTDSERNAQMFTFANQILVIAFVWFGTIIVA